jgi:hypothetical protein
MLSPQRLRSRFGEEQGATLAIVAISLIALFGMVVLVVDVGGLLWKRRELVNGSDAAALAAAKTCALELAESEDAIADQWAISNVTNLTADQGGIIAKRCKGFSDGFVTVEYTNPQQLFFAPVLGFGNDNDVTTRATAIFGPIGAGNPVPIVLNVGNFQGACRIPDTNEDGDALEEGDTCAFWYDNDRFVGSNFGFMNLGQWDVSAGTNCRNAGAADRNDWIQGGWDGDALAVNHPTGPTYVCTDSGLAANNWMTLEGEAGEIKLFPINDWDGSISGWSQTTCCGGQVDKYQIVGFAAMRISDVLTVAEAGGGSGTCSDTRDFPAASPLSLVTFGNFEGCFSGSPDTISPPILSKRVRGTTTVYQPGIHYNYVPYNPSSPSTTGIINWIAPPSGGGEFNGITVSFDWAVDGACGQPPGNASARCLVVEWIGDTLDGSHPGQGADFGVKAIALCDPAIAGSCDPIAVP